jgi:gamma-glutamyltranspeptidase/glutathione hydrolase
MMTRLQIVCTSSLLLATSLTPLAAQQGSAIDYRSEQPERAKHGMVVSVHHLASDAGVEILKEGGNAVDAAVATAFALAVVHPIAGNLGGGGFLLLRTHDGRSTFIDFREEAPLAASADMYLDAKGNVLRRRRSASQHHRLSRDCHARLGRRLGLCREKVRQAWA